MIDNEKIEYKDPKIGAIVIHLKRKPDYFIGHQIENLLELLVRTCNNHAMEINRLKGMEVDPKDYQVYIE